MRKHRIDVFLGEIKQPRWENEPLGYQWIFLRYIALRGWKGILAVDDGRCNSRIKGETVYPPHLYCWLCTCITTAPKRAQIKQLLICWQPCKFRSLYAVDVKITAPQPVSQTDAKKHKNIKKGSAHASVLCKTARQIISGRESKSHANWRWSF